MAATTVRVPSPISEVCRLIYKALLQFACGESPSTCRVTRPFVLIPSELKGMVGTQQTKCPYSKEVISL